MDKEKTGKEILDQAKTYMEEQGVMDIVEIFGFFGELIELLKGQEIDTVEYFI